jgi:hypothetical protein
MLRRILSLVLVAGFALAAPAAEPATGNWKVTFSPTSTVDVIEGIVKLEKKDGAWTASVASPGYSRDLKVDGITVDGDRVKLTFKKGPATGSFEGKITGEKAIRGDYDDGRAVYAANMTWTEDDTISQQASIVRKAPPAPLAELNKMRMAASQARAKLRNAKDDDEKKQINDEFNAKMKEADAAAPAAFRKVISDFPTDVAVIEAVSQLIQGASKNGVKADDARAWVAAANKMAEGYGPRFARETDINLAEGLSRQADLKPLAMELAAKADKAMGENGPAAAQVRVVSILMTAAGEGTPAGKGFAARLEKLETKLDEEYLAKHAKFEVAPYAGRKDGGNKVVLLELFTGAQCPPCVAADVAFDKLATAYKPTDVILLQYHLHIPGPDPLTNADTEARWNYYSKAFPDEVGGTPTTVFNGQPKAGGGGGEANAPNKLTAYRKVIDPVLNEKSDAKLTLKAMRSGDEIKLAASADLAEAGENLKLHFALVEETVRYPGGNGLRFHHHVVRALPGGADGMALAGKSEQRQASVNLAELRGKLTKYLDETGARRPYPKPYRPMEMKKLKAVAWVQDHKTHEVITAVEAEIGEGAAG